MFEEQSQRMFVSQAGLHPLYCNAISHWGNTLLALQSFGCAGLSPGPMGSAWSKTLRRSWQIFPLLLLRKKETKHHIYLLLLCQNVTCKQAHWGKEALPEN